MSEPATLEEIVYEPTFNDEGKRIGWQPSKADRRRFDQGSRYPGTGTHAIHPTEPEEKQHREYDEIQDELDAWAIGDERLYGQLKALFNRNPLIADRIAAAAVRGAQTGGLHDPTAFLASRLRPGK